MLTDIAIVRATREPRGPKGRKLHDERGLYLLLTPAGTALWRFKYAFGRKVAATGKRAGKLVGIEKLIGFGSYPETSLKRAREKRDEARQQIRDGIDPSAERQKATRMVANSFAEVAEEYVAKQEKKLAPRTITKARGHLRMWVNPHIGKKAIGDIQAPDLLYALRKVEATGKIETAHKVKELCGRVFLYGVATGRCKHNIAADLKLALEPRVDNHYAAIKDPAAVGALLRAIDGYQGQPATMTALRLLPLVFLRQREFRYGQWSEIDWKSAQWRVPAERMKGHKGDHLVPLSRQALTILRGLESITGDGELMFPAIGPRKRPISENTIGGALRSIGYSSEEHVPHGFRHMASTLMHELGWLSSDIELQLSHVDGNTVRGIYNAAERIKPRTRLMQKWSDYLDKLRQATD
jgi:integrase